MSGHICSHRHFWLAVLGLISVGCGDALGPESSTLGVQAGALTAQDRLDACTQDPRVIAGLVSAEICAGADIFFNEAFDGNGRTCGSCHPVANNTTIDVPFITALRNENPNDPLFVFEHDPALQNLEVPNAILNVATILENVDDLDEFEDPVNKFVTRSVPHVLSLSTTITRDDDDPLVGSASAQMTGWGGDGAPGDGSLREFLAGAINQHYPKTLARDEGVDFRAPTPEEADLTLEFQLALGRLNELDLNQVNIFDAEANQGRQAFIDPQRGRCNVCHFNAGANFQDTGKNRNFDTRTRIAVGGGVGFVGGLPFFDGGAGGKGAPAPDFDALELGFLNSLGNGAFNTPSLIEAADTAPFFHNNQFASDIEGAVFFYIDATFINSPAAADLVARFGTPINFSTADGFAMARFLRVLNVAFNLDIAKQRLSAALTLVGMFGDTGKDVQTRLMELAEAEIDDALQVLTSNQTTQPFLPVAVDRLGLAKNEIAAGLAASTSQVRQGRISNARSRVENARDHTGANINFNLGTGNLMF